LKKQIVDGLEEAFDSKILKRLCPLAFLANKIKESKKEERNNEENRETTEMRM